MVIWFFLTCSFLLYQFGGVRGLVEGDFCTNDNGMAGVCLPSEQCRHVQKLLKAGVRPTICAFPRLGRFPIICCPSEEEATTEASSNGEQNRGGTNLGPPFALARRKCAEYGETVKEVIEDPALSKVGAMLTIDHCGRVAETMILGGVKALPREFPHMALIGYRDPPEWLCGGSLISERFVLSAAHCSRPRRKGPASWVLLGELDTSDDQDDADPMVHRIVEILDHPDYNTETLYNDIALFRLEQEAVFNAYIRPICLAVDPDVIPDFLTASGWGHTEWGGSSSPSLLKVSVEGVSIEVCNSNYSRTIALGKQIPQGILPNSMICAGREVGKDTCQGDSGGPLQVNLSEPYCMYDLVGVTSFGRGCGLGFPGVYSRVSHYVPWIVQHVWPDDQ